TPEIYSLDKSTFLPSHTGCRTPLHLLCKYCTVDPSLSFDTHTHTHTHTEASALYTDTFLPSQISHRIIFLIELTVPQSPVLQSPLFLSLSVWAMYSVILKNQSKP